MREHHWEMFIPIKRPVEASWWRWPLNCMVKVSSVNIMMDLR